MTQTSSTGPSRKRGSSRRIGVILVILVMLALLAGLGWMLRKQFAPKEGPPVLSAPVALGDVSETVLATGVLKPSRLVAVGSRATGRITEMSVTLGQKVRKGETLATIDPLTQENKLLTAKAALASVQAQRVERQATLALNRLTLARQRSMVAQNAVSRADFETADAAVQTSLAQIEALDAQIAEARVAVANAEVELSYFNITAPIDGTVLSIVAQQGQTLNAVQSAPTVAILGQLDVMTVRADISEADVVRVKPGLPVYFTILGEPERRFEAKLEAIDPAPESVRSDSSFTTTTSTSSSSSSSAAAIYYGGTFNIPNPDNKLRTYMTAAVRIVLGEAKGVMTIPAAALGARDGQDRYTVRVLGDNGEITPRVITVGLNDKNTVEVRSGLKPGERVVTGVGLGDLRIPPRPPRRMGGL